MGRAAKSLFRQPDSSHHSVRCGSSRLCRSGAIPMKFLSLHPGPGGRIPAAAWVRRRWPWLLAAALLGILVYAHFSRPGKSTGAGAPAGQGAATTPPVAVTAVAAKKGDISIYLSGLSTVTPLATITIKSRVDGELMKVGYKEARSSPKVIFWR